MADHLRFVTYTYDDDHLPRGGGIIRRHINQCYSVRRRSGLRFRHFTVAEYGEKRNRVHWHSLQFYYGDPPLDPLDVSTRTFGWSHGNAQYEVPRSIAASAAYVFDYMNKGGEAMRPSDGLGKQYLLNFAKMQARNRRYLTNDHGITYYVPGVRTPQGQLWRYQLPRFHPWAADLAEVYLDTWQLSHDDPCPDDLRGIAYG